jgi:hypothetical protein
LIINNEIRISVDWGDGTKCEVFHLESELNYLTTQVEDKELCYSSDRSNIKVPKAERDITGKDKIQGHLDPRTPTSLSAQEERKKKKPPKIKTTLEERSCFPSLCNKSQEGFNWPGPCQMITVEIMIMTYY